MKKLIPALMYTLMYNMASALNVVYDGSVSCNYDKHNNYVSSGTYVYTVNNLDTAAYIEPIDTPVSTIINTAGNCNSATKSKNPSCTIKFIKNNTESAIIKIQVNTDGGITELESINIPACKK